MSKPGQLVLHDSHIFRGRIPLWQSGSHYGEVVFNTGMSGYVESLSDPSYAGQILVFTYPLIGNYGIDEDDMESERIQVSGVIVSEVAETASHYRSSSSLLPWLQRHNIPIIWGVDTRALTKHLRVRGTMTGAITTSSKIAIPNSLPQQYRTCPKPITYNQQDTKKIILVDCGTKENIIRSLCALPCRIVRVPRDYDYTKERFDGVVISNGPGDPQAYGDTISITQKAMRIGKPMFGICLGNQIMGLAAGARTFKLRFGHRGHNQPCQDTSTKRCYITSQNHGYAIEEASLPNDWRVSFKNVNDGSIEGIAHRSQPFYAVQFHPEACPGPLDTEWLFNHFYSQL